MQQVWTRTITALVAVAIFAISATGALADGLPVLGVDAGPQGVASADGLSRYVTLPGVGNDSVVARVDPNGGQVLASRALTKEFTIPAVAYDGSPSGLSADGSTLVLISPRVAFPRAKTTFLVLNARDLKARHAITLTGDFSFDAVSPDGETIYLIKYLSPQDPTRYEVRAYDVRQGVLVPDPIVDPTEPDEEMGGIPVTRVMSPDGRVAYTLCDRPMGEPFIHALDTAAGTARCIDLDDLPTPATGGWTMTVSANGATVTVLEGGRPAMIVDAATYRASVPVAADAGSTPKAVTKPGVWLWTLLGVGAGSILIALLAGRRRLRGAASSRTSPQ